MKQSKLEYIEHIWSRDFETFKREYCCGNIGQFSYGSKTIFDREKKKTIEAVLRTPDELFVDNKEEYDYEEFLKIWK